ncbi:antibiotic biosynthesis monooxygenase [Frankia sp. Ag45/Mut15]|uniref:Antibiotic biosynthesis monooxygenase n=1 Tax=Frankia umida TaxID=573489 RepID=A0ABT0JTY9_9ACTN|nr:antibiotic biosynthesis monooxygenase family protein [Frankia umida]MCK9875010.1 antibiotic biosynthesis monooxygenase [Frankia umida]
MSDDASGAVVQDSPPPATSAVLEVARFAIRPGTERAFEVAFGQVRSELLGTSGCRGARMTRGVESPSTFVLLVEWDTLDAHLVNFRESESFVRWRAALGPYFAAPPDVAHFADVRPDPS